LAGGIPVPVSVPQGSPISTQPPENHKQKLHQ